MMKPLFPGIPAKMIADIRKSVSACEAVKLGIATHAEKERCRINERRNAVAAARQLLESVKPRGSKLRSGVAGCCHECTRVLGCHVVTAAGLEGPNHLLYGGNCQVRGYRSHGRHTVRSRSVTGGYQLSEPASQNARSYGCTFGCGNPYDFVFIEVRSGTTEFLCLPCFVRLAHDMVSVVTEPDPAETAKWLKTISPLDPAPLKGSGPRKRGKNAPATAVDDDLIEAFDMVITADELPEEFR